MTTRTEPPVGSENAPMGDDVPTPAITAQETLRQDIEKQPAQESDDDKPHKKVSAFRSLGVLDRFLAVWILLAMIIGVLLGNFVEETGPALQKGKFVGVFIPIAIGLLVMIYPSSIGFSVFVNWVVAPFVMLALLWAFLPDKLELRVGLILVGLGRCIAIVLIWTGLAGGDNEYCAILVAANSIFQIVLFAPLAVFFIRVISGETGLYDVLYKVVSTSVGVFLGIPLGAAIISRFAIRWLTGLPAPRATVGPLIEVPVLLGLVYVVRWAGNRWDWKN
ncbi:Arsenical-resistance protein ACR3 [Coniochaeta hoffmannii]|uniref:Arsenical-resistance protein ACR3 n=1 Tax=Coniochaeta hoffmannii TaxID=91930 RepID=A0AA38SAC3_9PEZI|nr:Arsenical-resistance protein ACR3 [Coniochaeta hoffmannii]